MATMKICFLSALQPVVIGAVAVALCYEWYQCFFKMQDDDDIDDDVGISDGNCTVEGSVDSPWQAIYRYLAYGVAALVEIYLPFVVCCRCCCLCRFRCHCRR